LRVFQRNSGAANAAIYLEKTFEISSDRSAPSDYKEILFYSELRNRVNEIPGVDCAEARAIRWSEDSTVTLRLDFVPDTVVAESLDQKENAMAAAGRIANHFHKKPDTLPDWLIKSAGIGSTYPKHSIKKTTDLLIELGMSGDANLLNEFYDMRSYLSSIYKKSPTSMSHGDANHQNIRFVPGSSSTLFLDWPRVEIASVASDAARIVQPWIVFHSNVTDMTELESLESILYAKFVDELTDIPETELASVRSAYEIRSIANAIAIGAHVLSWLRSSNSAFESAVRASTARNWYKINLNRIREFKMNAECAVDEDRIGHLKSRYLGKGASEYNNQRKGNARWQAEHKITKEFLVEHRGKTVLDMPVGTGRFVGLYKEFDMSVYGMDRSADMLTETQKEAESYGLTDLTLVLGDATNFLPKKLKSDIVVCTRFLNWLPTDLARQAFLLLAEACQDEMLITLSSIDESKFSGDERLRIETRLKNMHVPKPDSDLPPNGAHSYLQFLEWIETAHMELVNTELLVEGRNHLRVETHRLRKIR